MCRVFYFERVVKLDATNIDFRPCCVVPKDGLDDHLPCVLRTVMYEIALRYQFRDALGVPFDKSEGTKWKCPLWFESAIVFIDFNYSLFFIVVNFCSVFCVHREIIQYFFHNQTVEINSTKMRLKTIRLRDVTLKFQFNLFLFTKISR